MSCNTASSKIISTPKLERLQDNNVLLSTAHERLAIVVWALTWLPGLAVVAWYLARQDSARALLQGLIWAALVAALPCTGYGLYAWSETQRQLAAHVSTSQLPNLIAIGQVALPYLVCAAYSVHQFKRTRLSGARRSWLMSLTMGIAAALVLAPSLLLTQLMVFFGG